METNEELINDAREYALVLHSSVHVRHTGAELIDKLCDALEAATTEPEWEYGTGHILDPGVGAPEATRRAAEVRAAAWNRSTRTRAGVVVRRRAAGPWLPVDGENE